MQRGTALSNLTADLLHAADTQKTSSVVTTETSMETAMARLPLTSILSELALIPVCSLKQVSFGKENVSSPVLLK